MSQSGVTLRRKADTMVPNDVLELIVSKNPHAFGAAVVRDGKIETNKCEGTEAKEDVEFLCDTMKTFMGNEIVFGFVNSPAGLNVDEDVPPYGVLSDGETQQIVAFVEGEFPGFVHTESSHPAEFFFVQEHLIPKLQEISELVDNDVEKVMKAVNKPLFKKDLMNHVGIRGSVTLLACTGELITFAKDVKEGDSQEFQWGWLSQVYGFGAKPEKTGGFPKRSTVREKANVVTENKAPVQEEHTKAAKTDTAVKTVEKVKYTVSKRAPPGHLSRKDRGKWYQSRLGFKPQAWESNIAVQIYLDDKGREVMIHDLRKMGIDLLTLPKLDNPKGVKDTETDHIQHGQMDNAPPAGEKDVTTEVLPIMSPKAREYAKDLIRRTDVQKVIADNAAIISDPDAIQKLEARFAEFGQQLGLKDAMKDYMKLPAPWFKQWCTENPESFWNFAWAMKNVLASRMARESSKLTQEEKTELAASELKPEKKGFPKRNAA